ncbi:response regulator transcription factor [Clostridium estertheticum]|uniref:Response regulator transcription factor n=1 Tax=Clostridium estertheticum TaxID=238834 RepID=A0AA47ELW8_9CLOT|nr:response regulator transcription factor [Clostridium estertheticum]MBU3156879.1 response regulator transcription factor [Clostridium estertheticum]MBU3201645.1 response regulator transcription factor [Clostridium estertheticum]MCB2357212.1 response regulator transcription factor [Clostridium estertheticum]WAG39687.1 response regulator transcription factor [Clostridium estertheticum]WAG62639.1 response regulator transcription factor [Clostridium estertheticum]
MSYKIYLVEDEENLNDILKSYLQNEGLQVTTFLNGQSARNAIDNNVDLWVLDITLPDIDGFQLLKEIKEKNKDVPVIFISARDQDIDRIIGLEMGSDDYLAKPFMPRELVIRVQKLLNRVYNSDKVKQVIIIEGYTIDIERRLVKFNDEVVSMTSGEFDLLLLLINKKGGAVTREQIINDLWGDNYFGSDRVVDDLVRRLRKKIPKLKVETIYGHGYRLSC